MRICHSTRRKGKRIASKVKTELRKGGRERAVAGGEEGEENEVQEKGERE